MSRGLPAKTAKAQYPPQVVDSFALPAAGAADAFERGSRGGAPKTRRAPHNTPTAAHKPLRTSPRSQHRTQSAPHVPTDKALPPPLCLNRGRRWALHFGAYLITWG